MLACFRLGSGWPGPAPSPVCHGGGVRRVVSAVTNVSRSSSAALSIGPPDDEALSGRHRGVRHLAGIALVNNSAAMHEDMPLRERMLEPFPQVFPSAAHRFEARSGHKQLRRAAGTLEDIPRWPSPLAGPLMDMIILMRRNVTLTPRLVS